MSVAMDSVQTMSAKKSTQFFQLVTGNLAWHPAIFSFFLPVLAGNVIGGTAIFTMLVYGQTRRDRER